MMFRFLKFLILLVLLFLFSTVAFAQNKPQITVQVNYQDNGQQIVFRGTGYVPIENIFLTVNIPTGACGYNVSVPAIGRLIGQTDGAGNFTFVDEVKCQGSLLYQFFINGSNTLVNITIGNVPAVKSVNSNQIQCTEGTNLAVGMTVATTQNVSGWTTVAKDHLVHQFLTGDAVYIIQGPVCTSTDMWWRVTRQYSFVAKSTGQLTNTEEVSWIPDKISGVLTLYQVPGTGVVLPNIAALSKDHAQLITVMSVQGQRVWNSPSRFGDRVTAIKTSDGPIDIIGQNESGTFLEIEMSNRKTGWVCAHLTINNLDVFPVPIADYSNNTCY